MLILASSSPRRKAFLELLGLEFVIDAARFDEPSPDRVENPDAFARALARAKASIVASRHPGQPVLAADTVVSLDTRLLGKPDSPGQATEMLQRLRGRSHEVTTGIAVVDGNGRLTLRSATTTVTMRPYGDAEIQQTIAAGTPFDKAGGYAIQDDEFVPVAHFDGCYCNVVGLPLSPTIEMLTAAGIEPPVREPFRLLPYCLSCPLFAGRSML